MDMENVQSEDSRTEMQRTIAEEGGKGKRCMK
jgi:hypothetical protein